MTNAIANGTGRVLVAIDIAKHEHVVLIERPDGIREKSRIKNRREDFEKFAEDLRKFGFPVQIGLEPTCSFHRNLAHFLMTEGFEVFGISTLVLARTREALHNSWDKNDPKDAAVILYLLRQGITQSLSEPFISGYNHLQELSKTHQQIVRRKTKIQHSIVNHYLPIYFPEAHVFFRGSRTKWFSRMLKVFPTPSTVKEYELERFIEVATPVVGRVPFRYSLLKDYYDLAQKSVGIPVEKDSHEVKMFRYTVEEHERLNAQLSELEDGIECLLKDDVDYGILKSVPGIGPLIALTVLAEGGNLRRFKHERQFLKYCGLNLSTEQSGQARGNSRLSKRGNPRLRAVFWQAARAAIDVTRRDNDFKNKYERYVRANPANGDLKRRARTAVAAKVARVVFGLIKNGERYRSSNERTILSGRTRGDKDMEAAFTG